MDVEDEEDEEEEEEEGGEMEGEEEDEYDDEAEALNVQYVEDFEESDDDEEIEEYNDASQLVRARDIKRKRGVQADPSKRPGSKGPRVEIEYEEEEAAPASKQRVRN